MCHGGGQHLLHACSEHIKGLQAGEKTRTRRRANGYYLKQRAGKNTAERAACSVVYKRAALPTSGEWRLTRRGGRAVRWSQGRS